MPVELRSRRLKVASTAETAAIEETPKLKVAKNSRSSKRKAIDDGSATATKKQKSVKTLAETKDDADTTKEAEITLPAPKAKNAKTPAKNKGTDDGAPDAAEKPTPKPKKDKTLAKIKDTPQPTVTETPKPAGKGTPKSVNKGTPKPLYKTTPKTTTKAAIEETPKPTSKATPKSAAKSTVKPAAKETPKPAKLATPKPKIEGNPKSATKETPKSVTKDADETPAPKSKSKQQKTPKKKPAKSTPAKSAKKAVNKVDSEEVVDGQEEAAPESKNVATAADQQEQVLSDEEIDEQTKVLVQTVDSGDEDEPASGVITFEEGQDVGIIPDVYKELSKKEKKALKASSSKGKEETGVIYIGRLPHGFYEHEMKNYFSQFGSIRNLRVSRNKKTGKVKHFAFVEFEEASTAEIVAKTMDNYLLFGHILKCSVIPKAQVHKDLFKGSNKRFKSIPWNKMQGKEMERPKTERQWELSIKRENKKRAARAKRLEALGYEFKAPEVKSVTEAKAIVESDETAQAIDAPPPAAEAEVEEPNEVVEEQEEATPAKKPTRGRGRPAKTPQKAVTAAETPRRTRRTKA